MKDLGKQLANWREKAGLSQKEVSERLGYTTPQFVSNWERGVSVPPVIAVKKLSMIYGIEKALMAKTVGDALIESYSAKIKKKIAKIA